MGGYDDIISGTYNTMLGYEADCSANNLTNATAIGNGAIATASNQVRIGNASVSGLFFGTASNLSGTVTAANMTYNTVTGEIQRFTSSKRYKKDIVNLEINTAKVYDLRPVSFTSIFDNARHFGLIAEEVAEVFPELVEYAKEKDVIKGSSSEKLIPDAVQYPILSVLLLKEVQKHELIIKEQQITIEKQNITIENLQKQNDELKTRLDKLEILINK